MRLKPSKTVDGKLNQFFATLASIAAANATNNMRNGHDANAEEWAKATEKWLHRAGADAARWHFIQPKI